MNQNNNDNSKTCNCCIVVLVHSCLLWLLCLWFSTYPWHLSVFNCLNNYFRCMFIWNIFQFLFSHKLYFYFNGSSVQFSCSDVLDSLRPHELQHARPPCPSPTPRVHSNSCPTSWWCHPAISSSVVPFSSCPQSLPASGSFPIDSLSRIQSFPVNSSHEVAEVLEFQL